ncbi:uncharacterized protein LOC142340434 [Convolutriloba macropyga]|uniref:uncharacterized protein LOC142340434 n=1 Tax=Convolutriloba macropyga TaxID=536237 RepID=UPI003F5220C5
MAFWLTFGQKMAENGVEIQGGASFVANQFNQMGFNDVGLDTKGRLTLQGDEKDFHVSVDGGNSLIFTVKGQLMVTSEKNGGGNILYKSRDVALKSCNGPVDGVVRFGTLYHGKPIHIKEDCPTFEISVSKLNHETEMVLQDIDHGGKDAIGWWRDQNNLYSVCPIVPEGAEFSGPVNSSSDSLGLTCIFETPCIYGPLTKTKLNMTQIAHCKEWGQMNSLYDCSHAAFGYTKYTHAYLAASGICYFCVSTNTLTLYNGTSDDSVCLLKGRNRCPSVQYQASEVAGVKIYYKTVTAHLTTKHKLHYIRTKHDIELTTDLGNASLVSWRNSQSSCEELCNLEVGQFANNSIAKYGKITGKCECFVASSVKNYTHIKTNEILVFSYDPNFRPSDVEGGFVDTLFDLNVPNWFLDPQLHCVLFDVTAFKAWPTEEDDYGIAIILKDLHYVETVGIYYHYVKSVIA